MLLRSLRAAGVPMAQVHVFIGGAFNGPPAGPYPDGGGGGGGGGGSENFRDYFDFSRPLAHVSSHAWLAMHRGTEQKVRRLSRSS